MGRKSANRVQDERLAETKKESNLKMGKGHEKACREEDRLTVQEAARGVTSHGATSRHTRQDGRGENSATGPAALWRAAVFPKAPACSSFLPSDSLLNVCLQDRELLFT